MSETGCTRLLLTDIRFDADCQSRVHLDEETVLEYAHRLKEGASFPPAVVYFDGSDNWLADGFHRFGGYKVAAREAGQEAQARMPCEVRQGTRLDAVRHALSANATHGKRREAGDYRKGYAIAVRCGLGEAHDVAGVRALLACSERWARDLTAEARDKVEHERNARIIAAREAGEPVRQVAAREGLSHEGVRKIVERSVNFRNSAESCQAANLRTVNETISEPSASAHHSGGEAGGHNGCDPFAPQNRGANADGLVPQNGGINEPTDDDPWGDEEDAPLPKTPGSPEGPEDWGRLDDLPPVEKVAVEVERLATTVRRLGLDPDEAATKLSVSSRRNLARCLHKLTEWLCELDDALDEQRIAAADIDQNHPF